MTVLKRPLVAWRVLPMEGGLTPERIQLHAEVLPIGTRYRFTKDDSDTVHAYVHVADIMYRVVKAELVAATRE